MKRIVSRKKPNIEERKLIDRDELIKDICKNCCCYYGEGVCSSDFCMVTDIIKKQKTYLTLYLPAKRYIGAGAATTTITTESTNPFFMPIDPNINPV